MLSILPKAWELFLFLIILTLFLIISSSSNAFTVAKDPEYIDDLDIEASDQLSRSKILKCHYKSGFDQVLKSSKPLIYRDNLNLSIVLEEIDFNAGKAILSEPSGEHSVSCTKSEASIMFLKKDENGSFIMITVYGRYDYGTRNYLSVISEHGFSKFRGPLVRGYNGFCEGSD